MRRLEIKTFILLSLFFSMKRKIFFMITQVDFPFGSAEILVNKVLSKISMKIKTNRDKECTGFH